MDIWAFFALFFWLSQASLVVGISTVTVVTTSSSATAVDRRADTVVTEASWITSAIIYPITEVIEIWSTNGVNKTTSFPTSNTFSTRWTTIETMVVVTSSVLNTAPPTPTPTPAPTTSTSMTTFATQPTQTTSATPPANVTITQEAASNTPTIIGEAIGAVFGAVFVAILIWIFCRKKRYHQEDNEHQGRMRRIKESWLPKVFQSSQAQSSAHPIQISTPIPMMAQKTPPRPGRPASLTESTVHAMSSSPVSYGRNTSENMPMPNDYYGTGRGDQPRSAPDAARYQTPPPRVPRPASSMYSQQPYSGPRFRGNNDHPTDIGYAIDETIDSIRGSAGPSSPRPYRESVGSLELDYDSEYEESPHRPRVAHEQRYTAFALPPVPAFRRDEDEQDQDKVRRERQRAMEQLEGRRGPQYYYNG